MFDRSRKTIAVALVSAAAMTAAIVPASAHSASYCRANVPQKVHGGFNPLLLLPLAAVGAGAGALVGVAASGIAVGTGAAVGAGTGAGIGLLGGTAHKGGYDYAEAYEACRSER